MTTPQEIIRTWCASCGMPAPSNGEVGALVSLLFPDMSVAESLGEHQDSAATWVALTDEDRDRAFQTLPDMLDGFMKKWGWLHFAKAIEDICREKNAPTGEQQ